MININIDAVFSERLTEKTLEANLCKAVEAQKTLEEGTGAGNDFIGWLHLPSSISDSDLSDIENTANLVRELCDVVVVAGIGGSYLGARAVIESVISSFDLLDTNRKSPVILYAGNNISEDYLYETAL